MVLEPPCAEGHGDWNMMNMKYWAGEIGRRLVRWAERDSNYLKHARSEWAIVFPEKDEMQDAIGENIFDVVAMFGLEGHSGSSAPYAIHYIEKALRFESFGPLTGDDAEWGEPFEYDGCCQNKRCSHVFKDVDGRAYDIDGRVFRDPDGCCYTNKDSRVYITFPYTPKTEYVDVPA
jgi:hypothetical protein